jgi:hypothetical protein
MSNNSNQLIIPQITGYGLKGFEDNAGHFRQQLLSNRDRMNAIDKPIDSFSERASSYIQDRTYKKVYDTQMSELSWFEKNIHLNSAKEKQLQDARTKKAQQDDLIVQGIIIVGTLALKYGLPYFADKRRKTKFAETSHQILSYVAATNNEISEHDHTIIRSVMLSMENSGVISDKKRKQIPLNRVPTTIHGINDCDSIHEFKVFIGSNVYKIMQNKGYSNNDILNNRRAIFEIIGFDSRNELKDFIDYSHDDYSKLKIQNSGFQEIIHSIVSDASTSLNRSRENCIQNSILLNSYDPFKETRQKNIERIKKGGQIASEIAIGVAQGGHPAAITAYTLSKHLLVDKKDKNANEVFQVAYEKSLVKKGVSKNDVMDFIKQGEALYKSVYA